MHSDDLDFTIASTPDIIDNIQKNLNDAPDEISVNIILKGTSAKKFYFVKTILASSYPELSEEEIDKYIIRSGAERELERFNRIWNQD